MDKFCEDCVHNEVCQYGAIPPHIGHCNDKETIDDLRPQGEWARHDEWVGGEYVGGFYHVNCPCIDLETAYYSKWRTHFCPNCGAKMLKGK